MSILKLKYWYQNNYSLKYNFKKIAMKKLFTLLALVALVSLQVVL
jgi:hypothetical protein